MFYCTDSNKKIKCDEEELQKKNKKLTDIKMKEKEAE